MGEFFCRMGVRSSPISRGLRGVLFVEQAGSRTRRYTAWRPRQAAWQFGSRGGAAIGELTVGQQPEKFVVEQIYRETEAGSIIKGIGLPAFINNGGYHQVLIGVYEDGLIDCWGLVTLQEFKEHVRSGWVVTQVPKGAPVSFHHLFSGKCDFECYVKVEELVKEVEDVLGQFHGVSTSSQRCVDAFRRYLFAPSVPLREALREAYTAVPEHLREYLLGDMDSRDGPIRCILDAAPPRPLKEGDIEFWKEHYFAGTGGPTNRSTE
jgi:hypothetical protein